MTQAERERLARENRLARIEETKIRAKAEEKAQLIPKEKIRAFLEKARKNASSQFYISTNGQWGYWSSRSFERVYILGVLVFEKDK